MKKVIFVVLLLMNFSLFSQVFHYEVRANKLGELGCARIDEHSRVTYFSYTDFYKCTENKLDKLILRSNSIGELVCSLLDIDNKVLGSSYNLSVCHVEDGEYFSIIKNKLGDRRCALFSKDDKIIGTSHSLKWCK